ncbi:hypothetical protein B0T14DRAFT_44055 [Immersiella caudata]|uniref:Uncharacterized protein n=1 Tax=Immersiella caudata TaxID=314043 RepID=A0AA39XF42_9PEZI|nr:hypothetical protein B0T14DRAFT_44055 [Immersiella caudata]
MWVFVPGDRLAAIASALGGEGLAWLLREACDDSCATHLPNMTIPIPQGLPEGVAPAGLHSGHRKSMTRHRTGSRNSSLRFPSAQRALASFKHRRDLNRKQPTKST